MTKATIRTKFAHSFTVFWHPPRYPVKWVEKSEDVPPWDSTRGGKGYFAAPYEFDYQSYKKYVDEWNKLNLKDEMEILEPPRRGYPRLVRESYTTQELEWYKSNKQPSDTLVNLLANLIPANRLTAYDQIFDSEQSKQGFIKIVSDQFKQGVIDIVEQYGAYSAESAGNAIDWVGIAAFAAGHLDFLNRLKEAISIVDVQLSLCEDWGIQILFEGERFEDWGTKREERLKMPEQWSYKADGHLARVAATVFFSFSTQTAPEEGIQTARGYRAFAAKNLKANFKDYATDTSIMKLEPEDSAIYLQVGVEGWLLWEIAELYERSTKVEQCPGCGRTFEARGKRKFCVANTSKCRMRAIRKNLELEP
jgi:hypothetical protein